MYLQKGLATQFVDQALAETVILIFDAQVSGIQYSFSKA